MDIDYTPEFKNESKIHLKYISCSNQNLLSTNEMKFNNIRFKNKNSSNALVDDFSSNDGVCTTIRSIKTEIFQDLSNKNSSMLM